MIRIVSALCLALAAALLVPGAFPAAAAEAFKIADCYGCHDTIEKLPEKNKHAKVLCDSCHGGIDKHLADEKVRPATKFGWFQK